MKRLVLGLIASLWASAVWAEGLPVTLRAQALVEGDVVRLGDLWDNLGDKAETVVAGSPIPGKRITADSRWLQNIANSYGVQWTPASQFDRIVIERSGTMIDGLTVEQALRDALRQDGVGEGFDLEISNRNALAMMVPTVNGKAPIAITDLVYDRQSQRFQATVEAPAGLPSAVRNRVAGRLVETREIPVLARPLQRGDVIKASDIAWVSVREDKVRRDILVDADQLIGQQLRSAVRDNVPLRANELRRPELVARNALVTILLQGNGMNLSAQGKANEAGSKGDLIKVTNMTTKRVVEGVVVGPDQVMVNFGATPKTAHR